MTPEPLTPVENELQREQFHALLNHAPIGVYLVDQDFRIREVNAAALPAFGNIPDLIGRDFEEVINKIWQEDYACDILKQFRRTLETGEPYFSSDRLEMRRDRNVTECYQWQVARISLPGNRRGIVCYFRDISARVMAEIALRSRQADLNESQRLAHIGGWHWDAATGVTIGSDELFRIYGVAPAETFPDFEMQRGTLYPDESWEKMRAAGKQALRTGEPYELDIEALRNGERIWVMTRGEVVRDAEGQIVGLRGTVQDITERKRSEELLRRSRDQIRLISDAVPVLISYVDTDFRYQFCNNAYTQWFGLESDAFVGRTMADVVGESVWRIIKPHVEKALTGEAVEYEAHAEYPTGARWIQAVYKPHRDQNGRILGIVVMVNDITDHKRHEDVLRQSEAASRAASLAKDNFLAQLSHELRTPLTPVLMTAAALREDDTLPEHVREQLAMVERNVALEARLIDDLLDLTRITRGKFALRTAPCDAHSLIGLAVEIVKDEAREKRIDMELNLDAQRSHLPGDPSRLQQVFWNLFRNAVKFTPHGGHVRISTKDCADSSETDADWRIRIEVSDDGIGFGPGIGERIFEPFEQGTAANDQRFPGLGLGLSIARAIVDLHGGAISAFSAGPGKGAIFTVELPEARQPSTSEPQQGKTHLSTPEPEPRLRLLLVEDHEPTLQVLARLLTRAGHDVIAASSVADALAHAAANTFDAVMSDLGLPDGTGIELMEQLRARHGLRGIALSGYGMDEDVRRSHDAGFIAHLIKPVDLNEVRRSLRLFVRTPAQE